VREGSSPWENAPPPTLALEFATFADSSERNFAATASARASILFAGPSSIDSTGISLSGSSVRDKSECGFECREGGALSTLIARCEWILAKLRDEGGGLRDDACLRAAEKLVAHS